ncbi:uncharacterized protein FIBRA_03578 [Fibroporia radiculosa]|uniref:Uncharacterized protein n=1 Tax=Fibroporia radiculosa TaxID=599839 RepID=J4HW25_9APHY|nr:uncharacterized protein FIBRA_03578 [Fibroporia radiculosa]CCM01522.1 predicted protein [Fibroporia radiculosa]
MAPSYSHLDRPEESPRRPFVRNLDNKFDARVSLFVGVCYYLFPLRKARSLTTAWALEMETVYYDEWQEFWEEAKEQYAIFFYRQLQVFWRTPLEIMEEIYHRSWNYCWWPLIPTTRPYLPDARFFPAPGHVRVYWQRSVQEVLGKPTTPQSFGCGPESTRIPQLGVFVDMPLGHEGELDIGKLMRMWNLDNIFFIDMSRKTLFEPGDSKVMSYLAVQTLLHPYNGIPVLRAVEVPTRQSLHARVRRTELLEKGSLRPLQWFDTARVSVMWTYLTIYDYYHWNPCRNFRGTPEGYVVLIFNMLLIALVFAIAIQVASLEAVQTTLALLGVALLNAAVGVCVLLCRTYEVLSKLRSLL